MRSDDDADRSPIVERRGSIRVEGIVRDGEWEFRILDEDTRLGMPHLRYMERYPNIKTRSRAHVEMTMIWLKIERNGL